MDQSGSGRYHYYHSLFYPSEHAASDSTPFVQCCRDTENCELYNKYRPVSNCSGYEPPSPGKLREREIEKVYATVDVASLRVFILSTEYVDNYDECKSYYCKFCVKVFYTKLNLQKFSIKFCAIIPVGAKFYRVQIYFLAQKIVAFCLSIGKAEFCKYYEVLCLQLMLDTHKPN